MARISKDPAVRMNEILDAAETLFYSKGYDETAISDIVKSIGVAQGTFYLYFASKEAVLEAMAGRHAAKIYHRIAEMAGSDEEPKQKFEKMVYATFNYLRNGDGWMFDFLYNHEHLSLAEKYIRQAGLLFGPLIRAVVEEGIGKGHFTVAHLDETMDLIRAVLQSVALSLYQSCTEEQLRWRIEIAGRMIDGALGLPQGALRLHL